MGAIVSAGSLVRSGAARGRASLGADPEPRRFLPRRSYQVIIDARLNPITGPRLAADASSTASN